MNLIGQLKATSHEVDIIYYNNLNFTPSLFVYSAFIIGILKIKDLSKFIRIHY